jgi:molybdopterin-guanine dinucleotide biosynthesis protein A
MEGRQREKITGVVLAGGQGRRMGGTDKGLMQMGERPMITWVLERFASQVDEVLISANQNLEEYARFGFRVIADEITGFAGPLAGLHCALRQSSNPLVGAVPCDSPFLPLDLVERLYRALLEHKAQLAVARTGDQPHPVFSLCRREVLGNLTRFLENGGRKVDAWYAALNHVEVQFDDQPEAFRNINTRQELAELGS